MTFITQSSINSNYNFWLCEDNGCIYSQHIPSNEFSEYPEVLTVWNKDEIPF